jgi:hypothetical protein
VLGSPTTREGRPVTRSAWKWVATEPWLIKSYGQVQLAHILAGRDGSRWLLVLRLVLRASSS